MIKQRTICFFLLPKVHMMDLSGPLQVFYEAGLLGNWKYNIAFAGISPDVKSEQGLTLGGLKKPNEVLLTKDDYIIIPGFDFKSFKEGALDSEINAMGDWLRDQLNNGVNVASICSGALVLGETGILNGRKCTSHWKCIEFMKQEYPKAQVQIDQLYVNDRNVFTSAGMTSGIDMTLSIIEQQQGPIVSAKVAREMVVYIRRNSADTQQTIYLDYRTHFNPAIHRVQDYIISNPSKNPSLEVLASVGNISVRNLTRLFKKATGHTIIEFKNAVKLELAKNLIHNSAFTMEKIAAHCGFRSVRHFRRILKDEAGNRGKQHVAMKK